MFIKLLPSLLLLGAMVTTSSLQAAATYTWSGNTNFNWNNTGNWSPTGNPSTTGDIAFFNSASYTNAPNLNVVRSIARLSFGASNGGISVNGSNMLTLNDSVGILMAAGSGASTVNVPITLAVAETWRNSSSSLLTVTGSVNNGNHQLLLDGQGSNSITLSGALAGGGALATVTAGTYTLSGALSYTGTTAINFGTMVINGTFSGTGGALSVASAAALAGNGSITRAVTIANGGILTLGQINAGVSQGGTLTMTSGLALNSSSSLLFDLADPGSLLDDEIALQGDLVLDGILTVNQLAGFGTGTYRLFSYSGGTFTDNGLSVAAMTGGYSGSIDTSVNGEVRLIVVPEPSLGSTLLLGAGLLFVAYRVRKYRRA